MFVVCMRTWAVDVVLYVFIPACFFQETAHTHHNLAVKSARSNLNHNMSRT